MSYAALMTHRAPPQEPVASLVVYAEVLATVPTTQDANSAWSELTPGVPYTAHGFYFAVNSGSTTHFAVEIAFGASGSEHIVLGPLNCSMEIYRVTAHGGWFPLRVPANTRVSYRVRQLKSGIGSTVPAYAWIVLHPLGAHTPQGYRTATVLNYDAANRQYPAVPKSTYGGTPVLQEVVASTERDYLALQPICAGGHVSPGSVTMYGGLTFHIGASGSEIRLLPRHNIVNSYSGSSHPVTLRQWFQPIACFLPRGTRVTAGITGANQDYWIPVTLIGYA